MALKPKKLPQKTAMSGKTDHSPKEAPPRRWGVFSFRFFLVVLLVPLWIFLRSVYRDRIGAFGCFDDCFNYTGGYFILVGKRLFSEIFFNHQPLAAYISAAIQYLTKPDSLYALIYEHRMSLIYWAIAFDILLVLRFGLVGFGFAILYETTKGYLFGERFLAEGMIVYPIVYLCVIVWQGMRRKKVYPLDVWLATNLTWFIVFSREPYIPLALMLFGAIIWLVRKTIWSVWGVGLLLLMSATTVIFHDLSSYWFNVVTVNAQSVGAIEAAAHNLSGFGIVQIFLYPFYVFGAHTWDVFRVTETALVIVFFGTSAVFLYKDRTVFKRLLFSIFLLGLANIRPIAPDDRYYGAFHHIQWYGLVIVLTTLLLQDLWRTRHMRLVAFLGIFLYVCVAGNAMVNPKSYLYEKVDRQTEFTTNYAQYFATGEVVRNLSDPADTLFLDEWDDLIYWQAKRLSPYRYAWYTSVMPKFQVYRQARDVMFRDHPPDFYYGKCTDRVPEVISLPESVRDSYVRLALGGRPSCLYVRREKLLTIPSDAWEKVKQFDYALPAIVR